MKLTDITPIFCEFIPEGIEYGFIYISEEYSTSTHLCACGCGIKTVLPINPDFWALIKGSNSVSFVPSIGNKHSQCPSKAHYYITNNKIVWQ